MRRSSSSSSGPAHALNECFETVPLAVGDWAVLGVAQVVSVPAYVAVARFVRGREKRGE